VKDVLNPKDVMEILDIGRRQTYELLENPPFHTVRIGRLIKIPKKPFFEWLNGEDE
jgi:Helix-turn-helix domain